MADSARYCCAHAPPPCSTRNQRHLATSYRLLVKALHAFDHVYIKRYWRAKRSLPCYLLKSAATNQFLIKLGATCVKDYRCNLTRSLLGIPLKKVHIRECMNFKDAIELGDALQVQLYIRWQRNVKFACLLDDFWTDFVVQDFLMQEVHVVWVAQLAKLRIISPESLVGIVVDYLHSWDHMQLYFLLDKMLNKTIDDKRTITSVSI